jgi:hypothetical protein
MRRLSPAATLPELLYYNICTCKTYIRSINVTVIILPYLHETFTNAARDIMACNEHPVYICGSKLYLITTLNLKEMRIVSRRELVWTMITARSPTMKCL